MALQTTSGSQREKWVAAFLPSVAIFLVAFLYFNFYAIPEMDAVEQKYNDAVAEAVPPFALTKLEEELQQLRDNQKEMEGTIGSVEDEVTAKSMAYRKLSPTAKHGKVTALFQEFDVAILEDQTTREIKVPTLRKNSIEVLQSLLPEEVVNYRNLTLMTDYPTIVALLKKLPEISGVLPINITLKKTKSVPIKTAPISEQKEGPSAVWTVTLLM